MGIPYTRLPSSLIADVWNVNVKLLPLFENEEILEFVYSVWSWSQVHTGSSFEEDCAKPGLHIHIRSPCKLLELAGQSSQVKEIEDPILL